MAERDGKDQEEDSPKQAGSCWFARPCWLATRGANWYPPDVLFADAMTFFSGVTLVLLCFVFSSFMLLLKPRPFRSIALRYAGAPVATPRVSFFLPLGLCRRCRFFEYYLYHFRFFSVWKVRRMFFPSEWCFSTLWPRAGVFDIRLCEKSINQSIMVTARYSNQQGS